MERAARGLDHLAHERGADPQPPRGLADVQVTDSADTRRARIRVQREPADANRPARLPGREQGLARPFEPLRATRPFAHEASEEAKPLFLALADEGVQYAGGRAHEPLDAMDQEWRGEVVVVDDQGGVLPRPALVEVERLPLGVAALMFVRRIHTARGSCAMVPRPLHAEEDRNIPEGTELGPVQEDSVEQENGAGLGALLGRVHRAVRLDVEDLAPVTAAAARAQRLE